MTRSEVVDMVWAITAIACFVCLVIAPGLLLHRVRRERRNALGRSAPANTGSVHGFEFDGEHDAGRKAV